MVDSGPYVKPEEAVGRARDAPQGGGSTGGDAAEPPPQAKEPAETDASAEGEDNTKESKARPSRTKSPQKRRPRTLPANRGKAEP